jgi:hypothetical protein
MLHSPTRIFQHLANYPGYIDYLPPLGIKLMTRMVRCRDQEAWSTGMLFPNVHFSWKIGEGEGSLGGFLPRSRLGY